jgi:hypothetical protein
MQNKEISSFTFACRTFILHDNLNKSISLYRENENLAQKEYDDDKTYQKTNELYTAFTNSSDALLDNLLNHAKLDIMYFLLETICDNDFCKAKFGSDTNEADIELVCTKIDDFTGFFIEKLISLTDDVEDETFFWDTAKEYFIDNIESVPKEIYRDTLVCPFCSSDVTILPSADIFDEHQNISSEQEEVAICECGAFAFVDKDGNIIGKLGDKETHVKRNRVYSAITNSCKMFGMLSYEIRKTFQRLVNKPLDNKNDIENLDKSECNKIIHSFMLAKDSLANIDIKWPTTHKELMDDLKNGWRIRISKSITNKNIGRLLIPASVCDGIIAVKSKNEQETFLFPAGMNYEFKKDIVMLHHPSGSTDVYKLYPPEYRSLIEK